MLDEVEYDDGESPAIGLVPPGVPWEEIPAVTERLEREGMIQPATRCWSFPTAVMTTWASTGPTRPWP